MRNLSTVQQYASYFLNRGIQMHTVSTVQQCASCFFNDGIQMSTVSTVQQFASCFLKRGIQMHTVITVQQCASCFLNGGIWMRTLSTVQYCSMPRALHGDECLKLNVASSDSPSLSVAHFFGSKKSWQGGITLWPPLPIPSLFFSLLPLSQHSTNYCTREPQKNLEMGEKL